MVGTAERIEEQVALAETEAQAHFRRLRDSGVRYDSTELRQAVREIGERFGHLADLGVFNAWGQAQIVYRRR